MSAGVVEQVTADETEADARYVFDSTLKTGAREASRRGPRRRRLHLAADARAQMRE